MQGRRVEGERRRGAVQDKPSNPTKRAQGKVPRGEPPKTANPRTHQIIGLKVKLKVRLSSLC